MAKTLEWRDWSRVLRSCAGRFQRGRVQEVIRAVEARPGDEATVTELDLRLDDWTSAELKSVAAKLQGKALKIVLSNKAGEGFEAWRASTNQRFLRTPLKGDLLDAVATLERKIMIYEAQSRETISDSLKTGCVVAGVGQSSVREHLLLSATKCDNWTNFAREI